MKQLMKVPWFEAFARLVPTEEGLWGYAQEPDGRY